MSTTWIRESLSWSMTFMSKLDVRITMVGGMPVARVIEKRKETQAPPKKKGGKKK